MVHPLDINPAQDNVLKAISNLYLAKRRGEPEAVIDGFERHVEGAVKRLENIYDALEYDKLEYDKL